MDPVALVLLAVIAIVIGVYFARHHHRVLRARFLRRAGFAIGASCIALFATFLAGEAMAEPGGWHGVGLVSAWAVPLVAGMQVAWYGPRIARWLFPVLIGSYVLLSLWFAANPDGWRAFENRHGPIRAVLVFVLAAGLTVYGTRSTGPAGVLLLLLGGTSIATASAHEGFSSLVAAAAVPIVVGLLYLASSAANQSVVHVPSRLGQSRIAVPDPKDDLRPRRGVNQGSHRRPQGRRLDWLIEEPNAQIRRGSAQDHPRE